MWYERELEQIQILFHSVEVSYPNVIVHPNGQHPDFAAHFHLHTLYPFELPNISFDGISQSDAVILFSKMVDIVRLRRPMLKNLITAVSEWNLHDVSSTSTEGKMRTAGDILSRIQWDDRLNSASFSVLYLDRFEGLKSIAFEEVDWTDPVFPEHRIQAFLYEDVVVWDKRIGLDNVYGSRGSGVKFEQLMERFEDAKKCKSEYEVLINISQKSTHALLIPMPSQFIFKVLQDLNNQGFIQTTTVDPMLVLFTFGSDIDEEIMQVIRKRKQEFISLNLSFQEWESIGELIPSLALLKISANETMNNFISLLKSDLTHLGIILEDPDHFPLLVIPIEASNSPEINQVEDKKEPELELQILSCFSGKQSIFNNIQRVASAPDRLEYIGVYLTAKFRTQLLRKVAPIHQNVSGIVCIFQIHPKLSSIFYEYPPLGTSVKMTAIEECQTSNIQLIHVVFTSRYSNLLHGGFQPFIIISHNNDLRLEDIPSLLERPTKQRKLRVELEGVLGVHQSKEGILGGRDVIWKDLLTNEAPQEDIQRPQIILEPSFEITELHIFDFDGTLVSSPDEFEGRKEYLQKTSHVFPFVGYYGRKESLIPPLYVLPGPAMHEYFLQRNQPGIKRVVLTGRIFKLQTYIQSILDTFQIEAELFCKRSGNESQDFKVSTILRLLEEHSMVQKVKIWDDNLENLVEFYSLKKRLQNKVEIEVFEAPYLPSPLHAVQERFSWTDRETLCGVGAFLAAIGRLKDRNYDDRIEAGMEFLKSVSRVALNSSFCFLIGGFPLGIKSDIEICFLASSSLTNNEALDLIHDQLYKEGLSNNAVEVQTYSNQKRLKIQLHYQDANPVNFWLVVCRVDPAFCNQDFQSVMELMPLVNQADKLSLMLIEKWKWTTSLIQSCSGTELDQLVVISAMLLMILERNLIKVEFKPLMELIRNFQQTQLKVDWSLDQSCLAFLFWFSTTDHDLEINSTDDFKIERISKLKKELKNLSQGSSDSCHWFLVFDLLSQDYVS